jgi:hypothetical protein
MNKALSVIVAVSIGNFLYEALIRRNDWGSAFKVSYFQAIAIGIYVYI